MGRRSQNTFVRVVLVLLAVAAILPMTAQAEVLPGVRGLTSDTYNGYPAWAKELEQPYWFSKSETVLAPDDMSLQRPKGVESSSVVVSDDGRSIDFNAYTVTGSVAALLAAIGCGMAFGVWYSRKTKLSPA